MHLRDSVGLRSHGLLGRVSLVSYSYSLKHRVVYPVIRVVLFY